MKIVEWFSKQRLFTKLFLIMTTSIIAVCVLTSLITIRMSERLFVETFSITNGKVLRQIHTGLGSFHDSVINTVIDAGQSGALKTYLTGEDLDSITMSKVYYRMTEQMKRLTSNLNAYDVSVTVTGINGRSYSTEGSFWPRSAEQLAEHPLTIRAATNPGRLLYQYEGLDGADEGRSHYVVAAKALMEPTTRRIYGMIYIAIREETFRQFYANFTSAGNDVIILDGSGEVISSNLAAFIGSSLPELLQDAQAIEAEQLHYKIGSLLDEERIVLATYLPAFDSYLVNLIDQQHLIGQIIDVRSIALICTAIIAAALLVVSMISKRLTLSLTRLVRQMSTVTDKGFGNYIRVSGSYEVRELAKAFNYMLDELNDYIRRLLDSQREQRNAELAALQRQINPHFLYNTLASIKLLVQKGNKETATETMNALISLLQNTISNVSETITIEQELANLDHYVYINHVRWGDRIQVHKFVAPDVWQYKVPKLIIQPFIENAFFHAFQQKHEGTVYVMVSKQGGQLVWEVVDNGDGMDMDSDGKPLTGPKSRSQLFTGIGIHNVDNRIKLLYGESYGVSIESKLGEGTKVRIRLPLIKEADDEESGKMQQSG